MSKTEREILEIAVKYPGIKSADLNKHLELRISNNTRAHYVASLRADGLLKPAQSLAEGGYDGKFWPTAMGAASVRNST